MFKTLLGGCAGFAWARKVVAIGCACAGRGGRLYGRCALAWAAGVAAFTYSAAVVNAAPPTAAQLYQERCERCHAANGRNPDLYGIYPDLPDFTDRPWQAAHTKAELKKSILGGKGRMPAFEDDLDGVSVGDLIDYLRKFAQQPHPASPKTLPRNVPKASAVPQAPKGSKTDLSAAAHFYTEQCQRCHGADGVSPVFAVFPGIPDFTNGTWQAAHTKAELKKSILHGKGAAMPEWKGDLRGVKVGDLIDYLRKFAKPDKTK